MLEMFLPSVLGQWQSILRWALKTAGAALVTDQIVTTGQWANLEPVVFTAVGALVSLGAGIWGIMAQHPRAIKAKAAELRAEGH